MSNCNSGCSGCEVSSCNEKRKNNFAYQRNEESRIKKIYAIVSGKGGVGKSMITSLLASASSRMGYKTAVLDGDITGPSMTKVFNVKSKAFSTEDNLIYPAITKTDIKLISTNMFLDNDETPVIWRSPVVLGLLKQFYEDVVWGEIDHMFIDMPPGTGDIPLTVMQSMPIDGIIIVTSPQELVSMVVAKAINMAQRMNIPILGLVENMSYLECDDCHNKMYIFGESHTQEISEKYKVPILGQIPLMPKVTKLSDSGNIEDARVDVIDEIIKKISD